MTARFGNVRHHSSIREGQTVPSSEPSNKVVAHLEAGDWLNSTHRKGVIVKVLTLIFFGLLLAGTSSAQVHSNSGATDAPTVTVIQINWRQEAFIPALYD